MSRKLSLISAGKLYDISTLEEIARGIVKEFNPLFGRVEVEERYENFEKCLTREGYLPLYLLKEPLPRYLKTDPTKTHDIVLCICSYPIPGDGFGSEEGVAFLSTYQPYLSDALPSDIFIRRCVKVGSHELGHVFGLGHHGTISGQDCIMEFPPSPLSETLKDMSGYMEMLSEKKICCSCKERLSDLS